MYRAGQTSSLQVSLGGHLIARDVTAIQIAFWNAGRRAIRAANVLLPLRITFPSTARILEVKLRRASRPVTGIQIRQVDPRTVEVTWRILERTDGAGKSGAGDFFERLAQQGAATAGRSGGGFQGAIGSLHGSLEGSNGSLDASSAALEVSTAY